MNPVSKLDAYPIPKVEDIFVNLKKGETFTKLEARWVGLCRHCHQTEWFRDGSGSTVAVNPVSKLDAYPIPKVEDIFANLKKGETFTKLDLSQAYQQLKLDEESPIWDLWDFPKSIGKHPARNARSSELHRRHYHY